MNKKSLRQKQIINSVLHSGYESIEKLADILGVSEQTVRRDIKELDQLGKLQRTHGGAAYSGALTQEDYFKRRLDNQDTKYSLAQLVLNLIEDGDSIFLDTGTTCEAIAMALLQKKHLRIVTYSLNAAILLKEREDFTVAIPGGFIRNIEGSLFGDDCSRFIEKFRFDYALISVSGIDNNGKMGNDTHWEVDIVNTARRQANKTILVVDSSKFNKSGHVILGDFNQINFLVTDKLPNTQLIQYLPSSVITLTLENSIER